jgi:tetratricopeptide (TPR) repeat protein
MLSTRPPPPRAKKAKSTRSHRPPPTPSPEEHLSRAMAAPTPRSRGIWARRGLACRARIDRTTQSMLLRQLYLAHFEQEHFKEAFAVSEQSLRLGVLLDVVHQDAARACVALGNVDLAAQHLRQAARVGPPNRRAFHWWSLGSIYFVAERHDEAVAALTRASRWGTRDKPLYQGHLALARIASGERVAELPELSERLRNVPAGQGYGRFVLGHMAYYGRRYREAREHLQAFVSRTESGRPALAIALEGELAIAKKTLARMSRTEG